MYAVMLSVGLNLTKNIFQVHGAAADVRVCVRRKLRSKSRKKLRLIDEHTFRDFHQIRTVKGVSGSLWGKTQTSKGRRTSEPVTSELKGIPVRYQG
jgi:hypothetical protein